jgi:hypothetical protein
MFVVELHGPIHEHLARAHCDDEEGRAPISPVSADHLFLGGPGFPVAAFRGELDPSPHSRVVIYLCKSQRRTWLQQLCLTDVLDGASALVN